MSSELGALIRKARHKEGLTIEGLAQASGLTSSVVFKIESGAIKNPKLDTICRLFNALKMEIPLKSLYNALKIKT